MWLWKEKLTIYLWTNNSWWSNIASSGPASFAKVNSHLLSCKVFIDFIWLTVTRKLLKIFAYNFLWRKWSKFLLRLTAFIIHMYYMCKDKLPLPVIFPCCDTMQKFSFYISFKIVFIFITNIFFYYSRKCVFYLKHSFVLYSENHTYMNLWLFLWVRSMKRKI